MILDMSPQLALPNGFQESAHFVVFAGGQELDAAIAQIPHRSGDIESLRELPYGVAETNALDVAFVENLEGGDHVTGEIDPAFRPRQLWRAFLLLRLRRRSRQIRIRQIFGRRDKAWIV
jgi:hypothetical protein